MRLLKIVVPASLFLFGFQGSVLAQELTSEFILEQSMKLHDPESKWNHTTVSIHIQEPRIQNPGRYSKLIMNMNTGGFSLSREYEIGEVKRIISDEGEAVVLVNGNKNFSEEVNEEYRLDSSRNAGYKMFYQMLLGFPMSLTGNLVEEVSRTYQEVLYDTEYVMIEFTLKESIISDQWRVYFSKEDYSVQALKFVHGDPDEEDEVILFDGVYIWDGISIPRYRHWYLSESREYLGSDIIVKELD